MRTVIRWVGLTVAAMAALAGCSGAGGLHDAGPTQAPPAQPSPSALWPAADVSTAPVPSPTAQVAAQPLPGLSLPGDDLSALAPATVLEKDPAVPGDERQALGGCPGCKVYPAQYRDLTGDGHDELLVAVQAADQRSYLHVYEARDHRVVPLLALPVQTGFHADTVGHDLVVDEPTGPTDHTTTTFRWNPDLAAFDRQISVSGPGVAGLGCLPDPGGKTPWPGSPTPSAAPSYPQPYPTPTGRAKPSGNPTGAPSAKPSPSTVPVPVPGAVPSLGAAPSPGRVTG